MPQGRRLWRSLTVDEHLRLVQGSQRSGWTIERIYDTFPRLAERKSHRGGQLSGGEQQMLAISRALLLNPRLLVMDEPTEGLAPVIVAQVEDMLVRLAEEGEIAVLVIEQNIGVATAVARTVAIMVNGRINRVIDSRAARRRSRPAAAPAGRRPARRGRPFGRGRLCRRSAAGRGCAHRLRRVRSASMSRTRSCRPAGRSRPRCRRSRRGRARAPARVLRPPRRIGRSGLDHAAAPPAEPVVLVAGTLDTKGDELRFIRDILKDGGIRTRLVDLSTSGKPSAADVVPTEIALHHRHGANAVFTGDRGASVAGMAQAFEAWIRRQSGIAGIIAAGGSGGTSMVAPAMRALPIGVPKIMISTVASGDVQRYVGASDIMMMYSVTDVQGLNSISRQILANGAQAMLGMVKARTAAMRRGARPPPGAAGAAGDRPDHVRRHHAVRAADRRAC